MIKSCFGFLRSSQRDGRHVCFTSFHIQAPPAPRDSSYATASRLPRDDDDDARGHFVVSARRQDCEPARAPPAAMKLSPYEPAAEGRAFGFDGCIGLSPRGRRERPT